MTKYEEDVVPPIIVYADEISLFPQKLARGKITYGRDKKGERKRLPIKVRLIKTPTRPNQFKFEFLRELNDYHVENCGYFEDDPENWHHYGNFHLSKEEAKRLAEFIMINAPRQVTF
jgi:hypothetical protein